MNCRFLPVFRALRAVGHLVAPIPWELHTLILALMTFGLQVHPFGTAEENESGAIHIRRDYKTRADDGDLGFGKKLVNEQFSLQKIPAYK